MKAGKNGGTLSDLLKIFIIKLLNSEKDLNNFYRSLVEIVSLRFSVFSSWIVKVVFQSLLEVVFQEWNFFFLFFLSDYSKLYGEQATS